MTAIMIAWLTFASWTMLGWAAAALIPVILHFLRRRKKEKVPWAAMHLLRQIVQRESRRVNLQQLLLLFLRVSILLLLAVVLARPSVNRPTGLVDAALPQPSKLWIFVVDTSYSMGYRAADQSRMERAKQRVSRIVHERQAGDAFTLVAMDQPARAIIGSPTFDRDALLSEVQKLAENARGCDPASALDMAARIATEASKDPNMPADVEVVLLTDFGLDAWQTDPSGPLQSNLKQLRQLAQLTLEPILDSRPVNVAVESMLVSPRQPVVGRPFTLEVTLASYGQASSASVQIDWEGQLVHHGQVELGSAQRTSLSVTVVPRRSGSGLLTVVTPADGLPIDNRYEMAVTVRDAYRVLVVENRQSSFSAWQVAIQPEPEDSWLGSQSEVRVASELQWLSQNDRQWDALVLNDLAWNSVASIERLTSYVNGGGVLVVGLGKNFSTSGTQADSSAGSLDAVREKLLGFQVLQPSETSDWAVDPLEYSSPILRAFDGFPNSGLLTTPIFRFWRIEPGDESLIVDLATTTGEPLLVHRRLGKGRIACLLSAPEDGRGDERGASWNAMTAWPSFLPLAQQTLQVLLDQEQASLNRTAGQPLSGTIPPLTENRSMTLKLPDQNELQILGQPMAGDEGLLWTYESTDQRGVYRVTQPLVSQPILTVNLDPVQSSLESIDPQTLGIPIGVTNRDNIGSDATQTTATDGLWRTLLWFLGLLLVVESLAAWWMGRQIG